MVKNHVKNKEKIVLGVPSFIPNPISINGNLALTRALYVSAGLISWQAINKIARGRCVKKCSGHFQIKLFIIFNMAFWPSTTKKHVKSYYFWSNWPTWIDSQILPIFQKTLLVIFGGFSMIFNIFDLSIWACLFCTFDLGQTRIGKEGTYNCPLLWFDGFTWFWSVFISFWTWALIWLRMCGSSWLRMSQLYDYECAHLHDCECARSYNDECATDFLECPVFPG